MKPKKTKSGKWHVTAYIGKVNGKPYYKSFTADTSRECSLLASEYIRDFKANPRMIRRITVRGAVEAYIKAKEGVLSPSTVRGYARILRNDLDAIGDVSVEDLDSYTLQRYVSGINKSPKSVRNVYGLISSALSMHTDRKFNVTLPAPIEPERIVATDEEVKLLLQEASPKMKKAIILGSNSLRRGEIAALKYEDIEDGCIYVHADIVQDQYGGWVYKDSAKTPGSTRRVFMPQKMIDALGTGTGFIVDYKNPDVISRLMERLSKRLGIHVTLHSLRRYYASICHALGIPDRYVMEQGGWKSDVVMKKSYQHTLDKQRQEFQNLFNAHMETIQ